MSSVASSIVVGEENDVISDARVISVIWGEEVKRIGIDGSLEGIQEAIRAAFGLRTKRSFWLEDEDGIVQAFDRNMPLGDYTLHVDDGISIRICIFDNAVHMPCHSIDKTFYSEDDLHDYLNRRDWIGLKDVRCHRNVDSIDDLHAEELYHGIKVQKD